MCAWNNATIRGIKRYIHYLSQSFATKAGPNARAGFITAAELPFISIPVTIITIPTTNPIINIFGTAPYS